LPDRRPWTIVATVSSQAPDPRARLVLVDQNDLLIEMISACVDRAQGIAIAGTAKRGDEAVGLVERLRPDVVLLNLTLPDMSGLTALRRMKLLPDPPIVIVMTFQCSNAARAAIRDLGADDCIIKSEVARTLSPTVERLLGRRKLDGPPASDGGPVES
jgi:two-component system response regulator AlgR